MTHLQRTRAMTAGIIAAFALSTPVLFAKADDAARANNAFGFSVFNQLSTKTAKGNRNFSPLSAYFALSLLLNGTERETKVELEKALATTGLSLETVNESNRELMTKLTANKDFQFSIANSLWADKSFSLRRTFEDRTREFYGALATTLDFKSKTAGPAINGWVKKNTGGKIDSIVSEPLPGDAVLFLLNAVYLDAKWQQPFKAHSTNNASFTVFHGRSATPKEVPTMYSGEMYVRTLESDGLTLLDLPYVGDKAGMVVLLPKAGETPEQTVKSLTAERWAELMEDLDAAGQDPTRVSLPKLDFAFEEKLNDALIALGMKRAFHASQAQLGGLAEDSKNLVVSEVRQKTTLQVDEEGTKAAAVTAIGIGRTSAMLPKRSVMVDRPFVFALREKTTGAILFLGTVNEPEGGKLPVKK